MANVDYSYTSFSASDSVTLTLEGYPPLAINQFSMSFALNQIPEASCTLNVGRNAYDNTAAPIDDISGKLKRMLPATIMATFTGNYLPGKAWPTAPVTLFRGYYVGNSYQKVNGRIQAVLHFIHWLADLGFSSCLSAATHTSIASSLVGLAVYQLAVPGGAGAAGESVFLPQYIGHETLAADLSTDLWGALKSYLSDLSKWQGFNPTVGAVTGGCGGADTLSTLSQNNRATRALARIEGPGATEGAGVTGLPYTYGAAINFSTLPPEAPPVVAAYIGHAILNEMVHQTMWDAVIGYACSMFGLNLCPAVDRAVMQPDVPGWRGSGGKYWRTITPDEYDYIDESGMLPKPLRGVVVHGSTVYEGYANASEPAAANTVVPAGVYAVPGNDNGDGAIMYQQMPGWLAAIPLVGENAGDANGTASDTAVNTATTPGAGKAAPEKTQKQLFPDTKQMLDCYAKMLFVQNTLRGRSGNMSGRLRFDIAPGSHVIIKGSPEQFLGSQDNLGTTRYGQVVRVSCEIDAESHRAATGFQITALRNDAENSDDLTSSSDHPFFPGSMGKGGLPLLPEMDVV